MAVKTIEAYKTSDGTVHEDKELAERQERTVNLKRQVYRLAENFDYPSSDCDTITEFVMQSKHGLKQILLNADPCTCCCPDGEGQHLENCWIYSAS